MGWNVATRDVRLSRRPAGALEGDVLAALRAAKAPLTPTQVQAALGELAYNTIHTILTRLNEKGRVHRVRYDLEFRSFPAVHTSGPRHAGGRLTS